MEATQPCEHDPGSKSCTNEDSLMEMILVQLQTYTCFGGMDQGAETISGRYSGALYATPGQTTWW